MKERERHTHTTIVSQLFFPCVFLFCMTTSCRERKRIVISVFIQLKEVWSVIWCLYLTGCEWCLVPAYQTIFVLLFTSHHWNALVLLILLRFCYYEISNIFPFSLRKSIILWIKDIFLCTFTFLLLVVFLIAWVFVFRDVVLLSLLLCYFSFIFVRTYQQHKTWHRIFKG